MLNHNTCSPVSQTPSHPLVITCCGPCLFVPLVRRNIESVLPWNLLTRFSSHMATWGRHLRIHTWVLFVVVLFHYIIYIISQWVGLLPCTRPTRVWFLHCLREPSMLPRYSHPHSRVWQTIRGEFGMSKIVTSLTVGTLLVPTQANRWAAGWPCSVRGLFLPLSSGIISGRDQGPIYMLGYWTWVSQVQGECLTRCINHPGP